MKAETLRVLASALRMRSIALWERVLRLGGHTRKRLRLCESLPLGDRRFVAVVEFERERFLVGGTPSSLVLLARLADGGRAEEDAEPATWIPASAAAVAGKWRGEIS